MELTYHGNNSISIATKQLQIAVDPLAKTKADVVLISGLGAEAPVEKDSFLINSPGEYEIKGVSMQGVAASLHIDKPDQPHKGVMYVVSAGDVRCLVTGNIAPGLSDAQVDAIGEVNVLVVPVGGHGLTLDSKAAADIVSRFEPQFVVPVHYSDGKSKYEMPQDGLDPFLKETGVEGLKPQDKLKVVAKELGDKTQVVVLEVSA